MGSIRNSYWRGVGHLVVKGAFLVAMVLFIMSCADEPEQHNITQQQNPQLSVAQNMPQDPPPIAQETPVPAYGSSGFYRAAPYYFPPAPAIMPIPR